MDVVFDKSFLKSLDKIKSKIIKIKIEEVIVKLESSDTINEVRNLKKMSGYKIYYRIRLGDYRLGVELEPNNVLRLIVIAHRKDIYKIFP